MLKVVLDTNVYLSAAVFGGKPEDILALARKKQIQLFISEAIIEEITEVLKRKFHWQDQGVKLFLEDINVNSDLVFPVKELNVIRANNKDNRILKCAQEAGAHFIISGDKKHILPLKKFHGIKVVSPAQFLEIFQNLIK